MLSIASRRSWTSDDRASRISPDLVLQRYPRTHILSLNFFSGQWYKAAWYYHRWAIFSIIFSHSSFYWRITEERSRALVNIPTDRRPHRHIPSQLPDRHFLSVHKSYGHSIQPHFTWVILVDPHYALRAATRRNLHKKIILSPCTLRLGSLFHPI
ncbi:hypothetical protein GALMADRAFT_424268 [Galerina marginata CBS 339.88]|uniref:Uncharacterized protein n=1 Tax=Galerina marginata (strain CBS 339.88) TaxID=685588 RepID=A0A067TAV1_GALM3|nr:hypothetical protein GALMADRAFT_424268 [Galerina marginata CBS 339.88]